MRIALLVIALVSIPVLAQIETGTAGRFQSLGQLKGGGAIKPASRAVGFPMLLTSNTGLDLGQQDASTPVSGELSIINSGGKPLNVLRPKAEVISRLKILYPKDLRIPAGGYLGIPWEYDHHGDETAMAVKVQVQTDDPAAPVVGETFLFSVEPNARVRPYRSTVVGLQVPGNVVKQVEPMTFEFQPLKQDQKFVEAYIKDAGVPLCIEGLKRLNNGILMGSVVLDPIAISHGAPRSGETQIIAKTSNGNQTYFYLQWLVK